MEYEKASNQSSYFLRRWAPALSPKAAHYQTQVPANSSAETPPFRNSLTSAGMGILDGLPQQECTLYHETTNPNSNGNPLETGACYGLLLGQAEVGTLFFLSFTQTLIKQQSTDYIYIVSQVVCTQLVCQGIWLICEPG